MYNFLILEMFPSMIALICAIIFCILTYRAEIMSKETDETTGEAEYMELSTPGNNVLMDDSENSSTNSSTTASTTIQTNSTFETSNQTFSQTQHSCNCSNFHLSLLAFRFSACIRWLNLTLKMLNYKFRKF